MTQSAQDVIWLTQEAFDKLEARLAELDGPRREEIKAAIAEARDEGDLKENAGYHAARDALAQLEREITILKDRIRRAEIGETPPDDGVVEPGMLVTYKFDGDDDDEAETFLFGAKEMEEEGLSVVSPQSALGKAVNGHSKGESVEYETPNGKTLKVWILDAKPYAG